jgi:tRNA U34 5-methylaminomethyl-2-thiouridine-forming methyltransferase MnmC
MNIEITRTLDGSDTLYLTDLDEHYHSTFGAIQESMHVFIRSGFDVCRKTEICILEIGLGTGLNCFLTWIAGRDSDKSVQYFAVEKYPLPTNIVEHLNYCETFTTSEAIVFSSLHACPWECDVQVDDRFMLHKMEADLLNLNFRELPNIDLIYFDAFSPEKQPELWNLSIFEKLFSKMNSNGILVTYCAKGYVRRNLQAAGFIVERIPGPPGKREMIRATKA